MVYFSKGREQNHANHSNCRRIHKPHRDRDGEDARVFEDFPTPPLHSSLKRIQVIAPEDSSLRPFSEKSVNKSMMETGLVFCLEPHVEPFQH